MKSRVLTILQDELSEDDYEYLIDNYDVQFWNDEGDGENLLFLYEDMNPNYHVARNIYDYAIKSEDFIDECDEEG